jgi:lactate permease
LSSLLITLLFLRVWRPAPDEEFMIKDDSLTKGPKANAVPAWQGWIPWVTIAVTVMLWSFFKVPLFLQQNIPWPHLHQAIAITLYQDRPYPAVWNFQPMATGTAILVSCLITSLLVRLSLQDFFYCVQKTARQAWLAIITVMLIVGLAYLMNYSGLAYTLGEGAASTGHLFILFSPFLGWLAVLLRQRPVRQSAGGRRQAIESQSGALCGDQLLRWRHGQDDLAAEYRYGTVSDRSEGA